MLVISDTQSDSKDIRFLPKTKYMSIAHSFKLFSPSQHKHPWPGDIQLSAPVCDISKLLIGQVCLPFLGRLIDEWIWYETSAHYFITLFSNPTKLMLDNDMAEFDIHNNNDSPMFVEHN